MTALTISTLYDVLIFDSGASNHMSNKLSNICDFNQCSSFVSIANRKGVPVKGKGKIKIVSNTPLFDVFFCSFFSFPIISVYKLTSILNCQAVFTPYKVVFQDLVTKRMIGEGFSLHGLYYFVSDHRLLKSFHVFLLQSMSISYGIITLLIYHILFF